MADDLDELDQLLSAEPSGGAPVPTWPLALGATVVIIAVLMWITDELVEWWSAEVYCGWFLC